jgi:PRC-barrel domain
MAHADSGSSLQMSDAYSWRGRYVIDSDGDKIGKLEEIYPDQTGNPEWAIVDTGLFGTMSSFVPLAGATPAGEDIQVPFSKQHVKDAPGVRRDGELSESEEAQLYSHYGLRGSNPT